MRSETIVVGLLMACIAAPSPASAAHILITQDEAKLPPAKGAFAVDRRGVTRSPKVILVSGSEPVHSPMHFQLKFESFGGARVDPDSVKVTYLKNPNVDLTPRTKPFAQATGIDMPDAELPVGGHMLRVDVKDSDGRPGSVSFVLNVTP